MIVYGKIINNSQYNIGYICTKLQCELGNAEKIAMRWIAPDIKVIDYSFKELEVQSNKCANTLKSLGLSKGDIIFTLLPKIPEHFFILLGALKVQLVTGPLFVNFGEEAILDRLGDACAKVLFTKKSSLKKIDKIRN